MTGNQFTGLPGCDVSPFSKFEDYFDNPLKLKIETISETASS